MVFSKFKKEPSLTELQKHYHNSKFDFNKAPDGTYNMMVVDIGTLFVKYSLFISYDGVDKYLAKSEIKYMNEIYSEGKLNFNLLGRDIRRKVESFSELGHIDLLVIIPQKISSDVIVIPRMEYREKYKDFKESIKESFKSVITDNKKVYDWVRTCNNTEEDYHSIVIDSINEDLVFEFNKIAVEQNVSEFLITSPVLAYLGLFDDDKAHLIIDFGHTLTRLAIVRDGDIYAITSFPKGSNEITEILADNNDVPVLDLLKEKHNARLSELPLGVNNFIGELKDTILQFLSEYHKQYDDAVQDYCVIGGSASLELEEELHGLTIGINRVYPKMNLNNDNIIPTESRNYLFNSYGTFMYLLHNKYDKEAVIDFSASKSGGTGLQIKNLVSKYHQYRTPLIAGLIGLYTLTGIGIYTSKEMGEYNKQVVTEMQNYNNQLQSLENNLTSLNAEYTALLSEDTTEDFKDTGALLYRLKEITPPRFNIKSIDLEGRGDRGTIVVRSDSQVVVSSFMTLLQDPENGIFNKANIIDIQLVESLGQKYYQTTILVEGRKI